MKTKTARFTSKQKSPPTRKFAAATAAQRAATPVATANPATNPAPRVRTDCDFLRPIA